LDTLLCTVLCFAGTFFRFFEAGFLAMDNLQSG
jgi:hypothetical protein